jgi:hypothetical protein
MVAARLRNRQVSVALDHVGVVTRDLAALARGRALRLFRHRISLKVVST